MYQITISEPIPPSTMFGYKVMEMEFERKRKAKRRSRRGREGNRIWSVEMRRVRANHELDGQNRKDGEAREGSGDGGCWDVPHARRKVFDTADIILGRFPFRFARDHGLLHRWRALINAVVGRANGSRTRAISCTSYVDQKPARRNNNKRLPTRAFSRTTAFWRGYAGFDGDRSDRTELRSLPRLRIPTTPRALRWTLWRRCLMILRANIGFRQAKVGVSEMQSRPLHYT